MESEKKENQRQKLKELCKKKKKTGQWIFYEEYIRHLHQLHTYSHSTQGMNSHTRKKENLHFNSSTKPPELSLLF